MELACLVELDVLPLLIQMPFFSALFFAAQHTKGVADSSFLWHCSWQTKLALDGYRCGSLLYPKYALSSWNWRWNPKGKHAQSIIDESDYDRCLSLISSAGVTLYWVVGGVIKLSNNLSSTTWFVQIFASASLRNTKQSSKATSHRVKKMSHLLQRHKSNTNQKQPQCRKTTQ